MQAVSTYKTSAHPERVFRYASETALAVGPRQLIAPYHGTGGGDGYAYDHLGNAYAVVDMQRCDSLDLVSLTLDPGGPSLSSYYTVANAMPAHGDALVIGATGPRSPGGARQFSWCTALADTILAIDGKFTDSQGGTDPYAALLPGDSGGPYTDATETYAYLMVSAPSAPLALLKHWIATQATDTSAPAIINCTYDSTTGLLHVILDRHATYTGSSGCFTLTLADGTPIKSTTLASGDGTETLAFNTTSDTIARTTLGTYSVASGAFTASGHASIAGTNIYLVVNSAPSATAVTLDEANARIGVQWQRDISFIGTAADLRGRSLAGTQYHATGSPLAGTGPAHLVFAAATEAATLDAGTASVPADFVAAGGLNNTAQSPSLLEETAMSAPILVSAVATFPPVGTPLATATLALTFDRAVDITTLQDWIDATEGDTAVLAMWAAGTSMGYTAGQTVALTNSNKTVTMTFDCPTQTALHAGTVANGGTSFTFTNYGGASLIKDAAAPNDGYEVTKQAVTSHAVTAGTSPTNSTYASPADAVTIASTSTISSGHWFWASFTAPASGQLVIGKTRQSTTLVLAVMDSTGLLLGNTNTKGGRTFNVTSGATYYVACRNPDSANFFTGSSAVVVSSVGAATSSGGFRGSARRNR